MHDRAERVHAVTVQQDVDLNEVSTLLAALLIIQGGVTARARLELVEEVKDDLGQGQLVVQLDTVLAQVIHPPHRATPILAQLHDRARELRGSQDRRVDDGFAHLGDLALGELARVVDAHLGTVFGDDAIDDVRGGRDEVQVELALKPLSDDLQVQQPQEPTAESKAQSRRGLRLESKRRVVELKALQRVTQIREVRAIDRVDAGKDHRVRVAVSGEGLGRATHLAGNGVADAGLTHVLHARDQIAHLAGTNAFFRLWFG